MATHDAAVANTTPQVFFPMPGNASLGVPFHQPHGMYIGSLGTLGVEVTDVTKTGSKTIATHDAATDLKAGGPSFYWFEFVHALPRGKMDFGNIITLVQKDYEIYSAFRSQSVTLSAITNNALPGIDPNITPSVVVPRQTSILDATTTDNSGGTGLGTIVKTKMDADQDGLANFDTTVDFEFDSPATDVSLLVTGSRIIFMPMQYEAPVKETLAFLTDIITALDGKEQRISLRKNPRQRFEVDYLLDENDRQRMQAMLMDWSHNLFGFPLWHEALKLTAAHTSGGTSYTTIGADDVDLRVGGLAVVYTDNFTFDVITISTKTDTTITAASASTNNHAVGAILMPLRLAYIRSIVGGSRFKNKLERFRIQFEVTDNDTGALSGSTTPGFWSTYNSKVLFDDCNVVDGEMPEEYSRRVIFIDNATGIVSGSSPWDKGKRSHSKGVIAKSRTEILTLRKLLIALKGRQTSFYIPTFAEDLEPVADLTSGANTIDIKAIDYVRLIADREPKKTFRVTFTDDTSLVRVVQSSVSVSSTVERLTLDTTWPSTKTVAQVSRIQFYEQVRFDTDNLVLTYPRVGQAKLIAPVKQVFD